MESGLAIQKLIWRSLPGTAILYLSLLTHMSLGFWALYARRHFRWTRLEATQLVLGLAIPFLLADHVIGSRVSFSQFGLDKGYAEELLKFWVRSPMSGALQATALLIVWIHGCLGLHFWLRLKPFYPRVTRAAFVGRRASAGARPARVLSGRQADAAGGRGPCLAGAAYDPGPDRNRGPERGSGSTIAPGPSSSSARRWP